MTLPTSKELQDAWEELQEIHKKYLLEYDVAIPRASRYNETAKAVWLAVLWHYKEDVHKDKISEVVRRDMKNVATDQQVRHLKRDGWDIGNKPGIHCLNPYKPSAEFATMDRQRRMRLEASNFEDLKKAFGYRCASCGAKEGKTNPRYGNDIVQLQQGHKDPAGSGNKMDNIIPQCQFCNRAYRDDFTFDEKGRVRAVANHQPVSRARESVQRKILEWLTQKFKGEKHD